jgi:hypothetical protein
VARSPKTNASKSRRKGSPGAASSNKDTALQKKRRNRRPQESRCPRPQRPVRGQPKGPPPPNPQPVRLNHDAVVKPEDGQQTVHLGPQRRRRRKRAHLANGAQRSARPAEVLRRGCAGLRRQTSVLLSPIQLPTRWFWGRKLWPRQFKPGVRSSRQKLSAAPVGRGKQQNQRECQVSR